VRGGLTITIAGSSRSILRSWLPAPIDPFDIDFHQDLQHCLRYGSQEIAVAALLLRSTSPILSSVIGQLGMGCRNTIEVGVKLQIW